MRSLRICLVASEVAPFAKTGGLADVAAGLARHLGEAGHDVRIFMPLYPRVRSGEWSFELSAEQHNVEATFGDRKLSWSCVTTPLPRSKGKVFLYLVDCPDLFDRVELYTNDDDEHQRFALFCRATIEGCQRMQWAPDVFHCNDWHTGLLPLYLRSAYAWDQMFQQTKTVLTIHNIGYQGTFDSRIVEDLGMGEVRRLLPQDDFQEGRINFLKAGLLHADALTTVSQTYAREIQTEEFGMGLEQVLRQRSTHLHGIVNGVDYGDWDPQIDPHLPHSYSANDMTGKLKNKRELLEGFELEFDERVPVLGVVSRLTGQKGFELLPDILPVLLHRVDLRLVVLGSGEESHESYFQWLRDSYPDKVAFYRGYNNELAHRIEAGADIFVMPSRYEPCGLNQMYSLKYGTVPIVRRTGGLADTVQQFDPATGEGTGFLFDDFTSEALLGALRQALTVWLDRAAWHKLVQNGMAMDFSWQRQGAEYERLYRSLVGDDA